VALVGLALLAGLAVVAAAGPATAVPAAAVPAAAVPAAGPAVGAIRRLSVAHDGPPRIVDAGDRTTILRGVNVNGLGEYYQEWPDLPSTEPLTEQDLAAIAAHGFDVVRLIVSWSRLEPAPGHLDVAYLASIRHLVAMAQRVDLYVVVDMHQDAWGPAVGTPDGVTCPAPLEPSVGWDGAPAWATALVGTAGP
jgi:endoglycosylceramidase